MSTEVTTRTVKCGVAICDKEVHPDKLYCDPHWEKLPAELKERVCAAYKSNEHQGKQPNPAWAVATTQATGYLNTRN